MNIMRYEPRYRPLRTSSLLNRLLQDRDIDRLLNPALTNDNETDLVADWLPAVDIKDKQDHFELTADLPGVDPENIEVTMEDGVLTIQGNREAETSEESENYRRYERVSGRFLRRFSLPDTANSEDISATTRHGVLKVSIPKQTKVLAKKIDVKAG